MYFDKKRFDKSHNRFFKKPHDCLTSGFFGTKCSNLDWKPECVYNPEYSLEIKNPVCLADSVDPTIYGTNLDVCRDNNNVPTRVCHTSGKCLGK